MNADASLTPMKRPCDDDPPTIVVLGATGVGKGSTLNSCFRTSAFSSSHTLASDTIKPVSHVLPWRGAGEPMRGVDLCGFSDSEGRDTDFIAAMVRYLREEVRSISAFLLLLNSQEARVGVHLKDMLVALKSVFGVDFMKHVVVGFTRWDYSRKGAIVRRGVTRETLAADVNRLLRELLGHAHECECVFLDNTLHMITEAELRGLHTCPSCAQCSDELGLVTAAFDEALEAVRRAALGNAPFACGRIEGTLAERDVGRDRIERERAALARAEEALTALTTAWAEAEAEADDPRCLEARLRQAGRAARDELRQALVAKCKPDLQHVMERALEGFDARLADAAAAALFKNGTAAKSFNRQLRMRLIRECEPGPRARGPAPGASRARRTARATASCACAPQVQGVHRAARGRRGEGAARALREHPGGAGRPRGELCGPVPGRRPRVAAAARAAAAQSHTRLAFAHGNTRSSLLTTR